MWYSARMSNFDTKNIGKWLKGPRGQRVLLIIFVIAFIVYMMPRDETLEGAPIAVGGTGLKFAEEFVALYGVAAPAPTLYCERDGNTTSCLKAAADELAAQIEGRTVRCEPIRSVQFAMRLGRCTADGLDLSRHMVRQGWLAAAIQVTDKYLADEVAAREAGLGLWATNEIAWPE